MSGLSQKKMVALTGAVTGLMAVALVFFGNPVNMGICVACFIRDIAGAVGLHRAAVVQYIRPEIIGFILGSFGIAFATKEFKVTGGSAPILRFVMGFFVMIGALVFLGCPLRMALRLAGGDLNALVGFAGFAAGIVIGIYFLKKGYSLGNSQSLPAASGYVMPAVAVVLLILAVASPVFLFKSEEGPGSMAAPIMVALAAGLVVGALSQKSRLCMAGGVRDLILIKDPHMFIGLASIFAVALVGNIALGKFNLGFEGQPVAHTDALWNFLGMTVVGLGSTLLGGCPLRQIILAGEGNTDAAITFMGLLVGAAFAHNFGLASSGAGSTVNGQIATVIGLVVMVAIAFANLDKSKR